MSATGAPTLGDVTVVVMAKAPVAGRVKTRLTTDMSSAGAAAVAAAALLDTLASVHAMAPLEVVLALAGEPSDLPPGAADGVRIVPQRGDGFDERLAHAFADAATVDGPVVLVGMDTPQLQGVHVGAAVAALADAEAVLGPAPDGGWWLLALRDAADAVALVGVPMSRDDTGDLTEHALRERGLTVAHADPLVDVDTVQDAHLVAAEAPDSRFAAALHRALDEAS